MAFIFKPGVLNKFFGGGDSATSLQALPIDVTNSQVVTREFSVTTKPVEDGSVISDNIIEQPITIKLDCIMGNEASGLVDAIRNPLIPKTWIDKKGLLDQLASSREPFDVTTKFGLYKNMFFTDIQYEANHDFNDALKFTCTLTQVSIVESVTEKIPPSAQKGKAGKRKQSPKVDKGKVQGEKPAQAKESGGGKRGASWASKLTGWGI